MNFQGKQVLVFGSGISGAAASRLLLKKGATVVLYDSNETLDKEAIKEEVLLRTGGPMKVVFENGFSVSEPASTSAKPQYISSFVNKLQVMVGPLSPDMITWPELVILSPGVPLDIPLVEAFKKQNIPIWGEVELACVVGRGEILAITGTNGKTTTTALLGEIIRGYTPNTFVVGNIGNPYTDIALQTDDRSVIVAEMSSFQLETVLTFHPKVSAFLNLSPDHLDRHHTMGCYIAAKENIAKNQTKADFCIVNYEDEVTRAFGEKIQAQAVYFSSQRKLDKGIYLLDGQIIWQEETKEPVKICHIDDLLVLGTHNHENVMAAAAMALVYGVPVKTVRDTVRTYKGVPHRIEFVAKKSGVYYYNDSKATNPDAAIKAVQAMNRPTVLIGGGYDKEASYDEWIEAFAGKVKKLVLIGSTKDKIARSAQKLGFTDIILADTLEEAVKVSAAYANRKDAVLLSPACASWDMFRNYEERGDRFKELVEQL